jgi:penicillin-binding protein 1A
MMVDMMKDVIRRGTASGSVWGAGFHLPAGGKTGTTNDGTNVWFIGYTADLVAGVWMGLDKPQKIKGNAQGGVLAAPAWTSFMTEVYRRKPAPPDWPRPVTILTREVDSRTGLLASPYCPAAQAYTEFFIAGTEPQQECATGFGTAMPGLPGSVPLSDTNGPPPLAPNPVPIQQRPPPRPTPLPVDPTLQRDSLLYRQPRRTLPRDSLNAQAQRNSQRDSLLNPPVRRRRQPAQVLTPADTPKTDSIPGPPRSAPR